jgi:hypothetical protein
VRGENQALAGFVPLNSNARGIVVFDTDVDADE